MMPAQARGWRRWAARVALATMLLNLFLPFAPVIGQAAVSAEGPGKTIVVCTGAGMRMIQVDADGDPVSGNSQGDGFCPLCTIATGIEPARTTLSGPTCLTEPDTARILPRDADLPRPSIHATPSAPRAPPLDI